MKKKITKIVKDIKTYKDYFEKQSMLVISVYKNFNDNNTNLWTTSLTYYSILALVPVIALTLGITKGFGIDTFFEEKIYSWIPDNVTVARIVIDISKKLLYSTRGSVLTGVGVVVLLWSILKVLIMLEDSFNGIWKVKRKRSYIRRIIDYVALTFIGPIFFAIVLTAISFFSHKLEAVADGHAYAYLLSFIINLTGFLIITFLFTCIFIIIPNTKVKVKPALVAGVATTVMFFILKFLFIHLQSSISRYNAIYGSLAFIPIFLIWVQYIWMSVLIGAQISFSSQNLDKYSINRNSDKIPIKLKQELSILIIYFISERFHQGGHPYTYREISEETGIEVSVVRDILNELEEMGILSEIVNNNYEESFQISVDPTVLTIGMFLDKLDNRNMELYSDVKIKKEHSGILQVIDKNLTHENDLLIKDIVNSDKK